MRHLYVLGGSVLHWLQLPHAAPVPEHIFCKLSVAFLGFTTLAATILTWELLQAS